MAKKTVYICDLCEREIPQANVNFWYIAAGDDGQGELRFSQVDSPMNAKHICDRCETVIYNKVAQ